MFVEVLKLRRDGRRLSAAEVQQCEPVRGHIRILKASLRRTDAQSDLWAALMPHPDAVEPLLELRKVRLVRWDQRGVVLSGVEETWQRRHCETRRQSWWVRLPERSDRAIDDVMAELQQQLESLFQRLAALR